MDKAQLFMMLMSQAPKLMSALSKNAQLDQLGGDGLDISGGITSALNRGYDAPLIQETLESTDPGDILDSLDITNLKYTNTLGNSDGLLDNQNQFPSDWATDGDLSLLADRYANGDYVSETPALESAASMLAADPSIGTTPEQIPDNKLQELYDDSVNSKYIIDGKEVPDEDMDELHQSEMWDNGYNYKRGPLTDWYKKHKR